MVLIWYGMVCVEAADKIILNEQIKRGRERERERNHSQSVLESRSGVSKQVSKAEGGKKNKGQRRGKQRYDHNPLGIYMS